MVPLYKKASVKRILTVLFLTGLLLVTAPLCVAAAGGHAGDLIIGSTTAGGGKLAVEFDFNQKVQTSYAFSTPTHAVYTATKPGFDALDHNEPNFFKLDDGTRVSIEIVHIDPAGSAKIVFPNGNAYRAPGTGLENPGDSAVIGQQGDPDPDGLHQHGQMQLVLALPAGTFGEARIVFKLKDSSPSPNYGDSELYVLTLTNGHLAPLDYNSSAFDQASVRCQHEVGRGIRNFVNKKLSLMGRCLDKVAAYKAAQALSSPPPALLSRLLQAAQNACAKPTGPESGTMLAKIEQAQQEAIAKIEARCGSNGSSDFSSEDIRAHVNMAGCRVEELASASYPEAKHGLEQFNARPGQGGNPLDEYFPCLVPSPED